MTDREKAIEQAADNLASNQTDSVRDVSFALIKTGIIIGARWADNNPEYLWQHLKDKIETLEAKLKIATEALERVSWRNVDIQGSQGIADEALKRIRE